MDGRELKGVAAISGPGISEMGRVYGQDFAPDALCDAMLAIARGAQDGPEIVNSAPHTAPVECLDESPAARKPRVR